MTAFFPTGAHHSSVQIFLWIPIGATFDYFCDQDSHEMIALKMKQIRPLKKNDLKSNYDLKIIMRTLIILTH